MLGSLAAATIEVQSGGNIIRASHKRPLEHRAQLLRRFSLIDGTETTQKLHTHEDDDSAACELPPRDARAIPSWVQCPAACPFWAEKVEHGHHCNFMCVTPDKCGDQAKGLNPNASVPDPEGNYCRGCRVSGCLKCSNAQKDACDICDDGYVLIDDICLAQSTRASLAAQGLFGIVFIYFSVCYLDVLCRPVANKKGLEEGERFRSRVKLRRPYSDEGEETEQRGLYPLSTNLCRESVGGPGNLLHFNFQCAWIVWAIIVTLLWCVIVAANQPDLFEMGTRLAPTPRDLCRIVDWGHTLQVDFMWVKLMFTGLLYVFSFVFAVMLAVQQHKRFDAIDSEKTDMHDFMAVIEGLPVTAEPVGAELIEEDLKKILEEATGQKVIGVSVAWNYWDSRPTVDKLVQQELVPQEDVDDDDDTSQSLAEARPFRWKWFGGIDRAVLWVMGATDQPSGKQGHLGTHILRASARAANAARAPNRVEETTALAAAGETAASDEAAATGDAAASGEAAALDAAEEIAPPEPIDAKEFLESLKTTDTAFVIFESEEAKDKAVTAVQENAISYKGSPLEIHSEVEAEPNTVQWASFGVSHCGRIIRFLRGLLIVFGFLMIWMCLFYLPYAFYFFSFPYEGGAQPGGTAYMILSLIVVAGNLSIYCLCAIVSASVGFKYDDNREASYIIMYTIAIVLNTIMDLCVVYYVSWRTMTALGAHTSGGLLLEDVETIQDRFEAYPMQRAIGANLAYYNFPCCFLLPFIGEGLGAIVMPWHLSRMVVRSNPTIRGRAAETAMDIFVPMDMGRYADIILNVCLVAMMLYVPTGFLLPCLAGFLFSNIYIYIYDHYRVLRCVPEFCYASRSCDDTANYLTAMPIGIILSAFVYKGNCSEYTSYCQKGTMEIGSLCTAALFFHCFIHYLAMKFLLPWVCRVEHKASNTPYEQAAKFVPCTYFSSNPIFCLRSKCIYKHDKPCSYYLRGREHLMAASPELGQLFENNKPAPTHLDKPDTDNHW